MKHAMDSKHLGRAISASVGRVGEWSMVNGEWIGASINDQRAQSPIHQLPFAIRPLRHSPIHQLPFAIRPLRHSPIHQFPFTSRPLQRSPIHQLLFTIRLFLFSCIILLPTLLRAQEIIITLNIIPPYSAYVYDYADLSGQAVITLTNTTQELKQVRMEGILANATSGLFVRTNQGHRGPSPIIVPPGGSVVLSTQPGVMDFLDPQNVSTNASQSVEQAIVQTGQLPEGIYRLCVEAFDYNGPQLLSQPGGGCFSFGIYYANPPIITQPVNGTEINAYMTNPVFSWTPPLGNLAGALIEYDLLVTPVFPGQNPNDAIIAARNYQRAQPVLVKEGLLSNVYVRQVFDLAFEQGKQYAMQVTARDRNNVVGISNVGRSEISVFTIGSVDTPVIPYGGAGPGPGGPIIDPGISPAFLANTLTGKLHYFWHNPANFGGGTNTGTGGTINPGVIGQVGNVGNVANVASGANIDDGNRTGYSGFTQAPLAGVTVQLVQAIQFQSAPNTSPQAGPLLPGNILVTHTGKFHILNQPSMNALLSTTTTDGQGNFVFNVPQVEQFDFGWKQGSVTLTGDFTGNLEGIYTGTFRRVLMVRVAAQVSPYYAQPVQFNAALPANGDLGIFHSQVKSKDVKVRVAQRDDLEVRKDGLEVLLLRKEGSRPSLAPADEASRGNTAPDPTITIEGQRYVLLARDTSDAQGMAEFRDLLRFDCGLSSNNLYYVWARPIDEFETRHSLVNFPQAVVYAYESDWTTACFDFHGNRLKESCTRCDLSLRDGFGTISRSHPRAYKGQDQWLYHVQRTVLRNPAVSATVRNSEAGTQAAFALAEPGANWKLWRINKQGMEILRNGNMSWGAMLEANQPNGFIMATNALVSQGHMVMHRNGTTGNDGRIHVKELPIQKEGTVPVGYYYVLDVEKPGFQRSIKVVNRLNLSAAGGTLNPGTIGQLPSGVSHVLGGGNTSSVPTSGGGGSNSSQPNSGDVSMLRLGFQYSAGEIFIAPRGQVKVVLVNEAGRTLAGKAHYRDPITGQEGTIVNSTVNVARFHEVLLNVPSGNGLQIVVIPNDLETYDRDTIVVNVPATGTLSTTATVPYKIHRVHFVVRGEPATPQAVPAGQDPQAVGPRLANARVELVEINPVMYPAIKHPATSPGGTAASVPNAPLVRTTDSQGRVDFAFRASGSSFKVRVYAPEGETYVTREVPFNSAPGKHWQVKNVQLERGRTVRGTVTIDSAAVANAKVRYTYMGITAEATTNSDGSYLLYNVPRQELEFQAAKQGYVGMEYDEATGSYNNFGTIGTTTLTTYNGTVAETIIDFQLRVYGGMDFSRILGFPLEVTAFAEEPGGRARINGWVTVPDSASTVFRMTQTSASGDQLRCVRFLNTVVEPDVLMEAGIPLTKPAALPMALAVNQVPVGMYPQQGQHPYVYHATLRDTQTGIALDRPAGGDQRGAVHGSVDVSLASFQVSSFSTPQGQGLGLVSPAGGMRLPVFASNAQSWYPATQGYRVSKTNGQPIDYTLFGFQANSITAGSILGRDSLVLDTRLHTALEHIPAPDNDLDLAIGTIVFRNGELQPFERVQPFTIPLGQFSLEGTEMKLSNAGFGFKGTLMASGMQLPVTDGMLEPTRFLLGELTAENMTLMGTIPVQALFPAEFGYDAVRPQPAWYVVVTSRDHNVTGARISGEHLDGIAANRDVPITSIWLYSNGAQSVALRSNIPAYPLHGIVDFHLQSMSILPNLLTLAGELNFGIPGFPTFTTAMLYDKTPTGMAAYRLGDFSMPPVATNGVQIAFNKGQQKGSFGVAGNQGCFTLAPGQLTMKGVISDQDPAVFKNLAYTLVKTTQQTKLTVDRDPQQSVRLGGDNPASRILMTDVEGEMWVVPGNAGPEWNTFYIKGNMPEEMGFEAQNGQPQRMRFEVRGDLAVENQQVKLKDIETPFGNINMVYDMQHHRLSGSVNVAHGVSNGPSMSGAASIVIDKEGFYFMSGLNVNLPDPKITGMAFILLGDYAQRTPEMDALLMQYSLHVQKKMERQVPTFLVPAIQALLVQDPPAGVAMAQANYPGNILPPTYMGLFGSGRFNGFYFNAGAQIPLPVIPNFSIDCQPVVTLGMGCDGGIDVRFGANFGSGTYGVGFDTYVDIYMAGGASAGIICAYGRIGLYLTVGLDGVFQSNGNYTITGNGAVQLEGNVTVGGGMCSVPCNDFTCLHFTVGGTIGLGMQANISNSGSNFQFTMGSDGTSSQRNDPPPEEN